MFGWSANGVMAFASVVNVMIVFVLAVLNYRYVKSAAEQARAAREQASAAFENIKLMKEQIHEQKSLKLIEALVDFRRLQDLIKWWVPKLESGSGGIAAFPRLMPQKWPTMFQIVEQSAPSVQDQLLIVEYRLRNAEMIVDTQLARQSSYRDPAVFKAAANDLSEANRALTSVLDGLERAFPDPSGPTG